MGHRELVIQHVRRGSIAEELGLEQGDAVLRVDDREASDYLDYRFLTAGEEMNILIRKHDGEYWLLDIEKDWDEDLGLEFEKEGLGDIRRCRNRCIFCFVDQMPPEMRDSLYVKDDDYRLSFTRGNFITLTNTGKEDLERIVSMHLSPLYVSVHTTNSELRARMMRNPRAAQIMDQLQYLVHSGIEIHAQAVLCPGVNDGDELVKTVDDLVELWPGLRSLALVPVGLTGYRENLYPLRGFTKPESREIIDMVGKWQESFLKDLGYPLVFAADEFYLLAGEEFPAAGYYGGFPQTENGVGLGRLFLDQWEEIRDSLPGKIPQPRKVKVVTGKLGAQVLTPVLNELNGIENLIVNTAVIENNFFGRSVTVSGLLAARDIMEQVDAAGVDAVIIPDSALREGSNVFLDGLSLEELSHRLGATVIAAGTPEELVEAAAGPPCC